MFCFLQLTLLPLDGLQRKITYIKLEIFYFPNPREQRGKRFWKQDWWGQQTRLYRSTKKWGRHASRVKCQFARWWAGCNFFSCKFSPAELILNCLEALSIIFLQVQLALLYITLRSIDRELMIQWRLLCSKRTSLDSCSIASKSRLIGLGSDYYWCIWGYFKVSIRHVTSLEPQLINKNMNHYNPLESQFSRFNLTKKGHSPFTSTSIFHHLCWL